MRIRAGEIGDIERLIELGRLFYEEDSEFSGMGFDPLKASLTFVKAVERRDQCIFVIDDGAQLGGFFVGQISGSDFGAGYEAWEKYLYVAERYRKQGLGSRLVGAFVGWSKAFKPEKICAFIRSDIDRKGAKASFERAGFRDIGLIMVYEGG